MTNTNLQNLDIEGKAGTYFVPKVSFNAENGVCALEGESYLENTWEFYSKLIDWLKKYSETGQPIDFSFKLTYFNTSSSKGILDLLKTLKAHEMGGHELKVRWFYPEDDEDNLTEAEDFMADTDIEMEIVSY